MSVGFVPYTAVVNVGKNRSGWVDDIGKEDKIIPPGRGFSPWEGCVLHRADHLSLATPAQAKFPSYFHPKTNAYWMAEEDWLDADGPQLYCIRTPITPLSNDESAIQQTIADLALWGNTGNMTHLGVQWGRRVLAPDWRVSWGGEEPEGDRKKVLVLLTDGTNNVGAKSYSAYGEPGAGISGLGLQRSAKGKRSLTKPLGIIATSPGAREFMFTGFWPYRTMTRAATRYLTCFVIARVLQTGYSRPVLQPNSPRRS